ncbi:MAG TPA: hypothetical protein VN783_09700 [Thermoanaerobaculia bacterium]|nr:hypothetical protein [Thermoanaerobaculia bacterium]
MRSPELVWRERLWLWLPALLFFLANVAAFGVYRLGYSSRVAALEKSLEGERRQLDEATRGQREIATRVALASASRSGIRDLYQDRFSTRKRRLTLITAEVKELAKKAGLDPRSISYPEEKIADFGLVRRSFNFAAGGSYEGLRRFLNLLEISDSFLVLESMNVDEQRDQSQAELRVDLKLSTLFAEDEANPFAAPRAAAPRAVARPPAPAAGEPGEAGAAGAAGAEE